ncbi:MAG: hypothetical protein IJV58_09375 [Oscillospiraceae bacterium]|nr:hypothetical protein [Oscillospiraceae bacterium]
MLLDYLMEEAKDLTEEQLTQVVNFAKFLKEEARRQETVSDDEMLSVSEELIKQNRKAYEVLAQ